jgi:hypothetical protein
MNPDQIAKSVAAALEACVAHGFQPPLHVVALGVNGSLIVVRSGEEPEVLAEHEEGDDYKLPINFLVVARGEAAHLKLATPDEAPRIVH